MDEDTSDDELLARMRRNLLLKTRVKEPDDVGEQAARVLQKWSGRDNAARFSKHDGRRPFKVKKPLVVVEYYEVPPMQCSWSSAFSGGWRIDVRENGILRNTREGLSREECLRLVADCERRGAQVKAIVTEWMKQNSTSQSPASLPAVRTNRKSFSERYGALPVTGSRR